MMRKAPLLLLPAAGAVVAAVALLPWWLGLALRPVAALAHARFGAYERLGYARFRLHDVQWARPEGGVHTEVATIEADTPVVWLWHRLGGPAPLIAVGAWQVEAEAGAHRMPDPAAGMVRLHDRLVTKVVPRLRRWLPEATTAGGRVIWPGGALTLNAAEWHDGRLVVHGLQWKALGSVEATASVDREGNVVAALRRPESETAAALTWTGGELKGSASWWAQPATLAFHFAPTGWWPDEGRIEAASWTLPAGRLKLPAAYADLNGGARLEWRDRTFTVAIDAAATPRADEEAPAFEAHARAAGDRDGWQVTALKLQAPFAEAELNGPIALGYDGRMRTEEARLTVHADLAKQSWVEVRGEVRGTLDLRPAADRAVSGRFSFSADGIAVESWAVKHAAADGRLAWPRIEVEKGVLTADDATHLSVSGSCEVATRSLDGVMIEGDIGRATLATRLPAALDWTGAHVAATLSGAWRRPMHAGTLTMTKLAAAAMKPVDLQATWRGEGAAISAMTATIDRDATKVELAGAVDRASARLTSLRVSDAGRERWHSEGPATIAWSPAWRIEGLRLSGSESRIAVDAHAGGAVAVSIAGLTDAWVREWIDFAGPAWTVATLQASAELGGPKPHFAIESAGRIALEPRGADVALKLEGDAAGVKLTSLRVVDGPRVLTEAAGRLPLRWDPQSATPWRPDLEAPLELQLKTDPDSPLWAALAAAAGIELDGAAATATLGGTLRQPEGQLRLQVRSLAATTEAWKTLPKIEGLDLALHVDRGAVTVESATASVEGQRMTASARLPMDAAAWEQWWHGERAPDWRDLEGELDLADAEMAPLARRFPDLVATQGRVSAHAALARGGRFSGTVKITDAATRPIPSLGVVQAVNAELTLDDRTVTVKSFGARIGGQPVTLTGTATLPAGGRPRLALALKADNVPLVRKAGLLVRSDLDLHADTGANGTTRITGRINLRDCLVLADLTALLPGGARGVTPQPPYFAVKAAPYRAWQLGVELRGDHAIRVRTAVFKGTASARFQLAGTLGEPRAVGEVSVDDGQVLFPFATFTVQLGALRLQEADPFHPELSLTATTRRFGYDVRMNATGAPESPNVSFSASPSLDSASILLMVMAGQRPANDTTTTGSAQRFTQVGAFVGQEVIQSLGLGGDDLNRLEIKSGEQLTQQGRETYQIEYRLTDDWSLVGEYDEFDDYNAGVKWRVYTEGGDRAGK